MMGRMGLLAVLLTLAPLFNGKDLAGWIAEGDRPNYSVESGELLVGGAANLPNWLRTEREFENFRLVFEYRLSPWRQAAVVLRAPRMGRPSQSGLAIYLAHDYHELVNSYTTGGVAGALPPLTTVWPQYRSKACSRQDPLWACRQRL